MFRFIALMLLPWFATAAPFLVSDPSTQVPPVTGCQVILTDLVANTTKKVDTALVNRGCKYDLANTLPGSYEAKAVYFYVDPVWGRQESVTSAPFRLNAPIALTPPLGLSVMP